MIWFEQLHASFFFLFHLECFKTGSLSVMLFWVLLTPDIQLGLYGLKILFNYFKNIIEHQIEKMIRNILPNIFIIRYYSIPCYYIFYYK